MNRLRHCDTPLADIPAEAPPVTHPDIPTAVWHPWCPFRTLRLPPVLAWLTQYGRWQRYHVLPDAGGLDDQAEPVLQAFDVMTWALAQPRMERGPHR